MKLNLEEYFGVKYNVIEDLDTFRTGQNACKQVGEIVFSGNDKLVSTNKQFKK
jgi:hypothetical protein